MLGLSVSRVRQLADAGIIPHRLTSGGHRIFDLGEIVGVMAMSRIAGPAGLGPPSFDAEYGLDGLAEHMVWQQVRQALGLETAGGAAHLVEYSLEEMVNNAISHSDGSRVRVMVWATPQWLAFSVSDDGIGALERLRGELGLPDVLSAIQELSKGKRTTFPEEHSGQGIFFTSKALDRFVLAANGWQWTVDAMLGDQTVEKAPHSRGTVVSGVVDTATTRTMRDVFAAFTRDLEFARTTPSVKLVSYGTRLVSRSEAKLLLEGLDEFREVDLDFAGVEAVGQGFVDEVFRVWVARHPGVRLTPINMNEAVRFMVERGLPGARL
jgi:anti-sigma regulatory factor (Ser/Thr protein kinase)